MRITAEIRFSLSEGEFTELAAAAFRAGLPFGDFLKRQLLQSTAGITPDTSMTLSVAAPVRPRAEQPRPEPEPEPEPAPEPPPQMTASPAHPQQQYQPPPSSPRATAAAAPRPAITSTAPPPPPAPAPSPPSSPPPVPTGPERKKRQRLPPELVPRTFSEIVGIAEQIGAARAEILARYRLDKAVGGIYNRAMSAWYKEHLDHLPLQIRVQIALFANKLPELRAWAATLPPGALDGIGPSRLYQSFQREATSPNPAPDPGAAPKPSAPPMPELRKAPRPEPPGDPVPPNTMPVWRDGKFVYLSPEEAMSASGTPSATQATDLLRIYDNFDMVDLSALNRADRLLLRRFAAQMANLGVGRGATLVPDKIAVAIRKIQGQETANSVGLELVRLGVLVGRPGDYRLRQEFVDRFGELVDLGMAETEP